MFLKDRNSGDLVEVLDTVQLIDPNQSVVNVALHAGEEKGDPIDVAKSTLSFPSGEALPLCWQDPHYRTDS